MAIELITTFSPEGVGLYVEPTAASPVGGAFRGSLCIVVPAVLANLPSLWINTSLVNPGLTWAVVPGGSELINVALQQIAAVDGGLAAGIWLRKTYVAADGNLDVVLPVRTGGWRVVDAYIISDGGGGAESLQVQTTAAVAITDAMVRGAANVITRAASVDRVAGAIASGGSVRLAKAGGGASGGEAFVRIEGL
jgi:hypothetical protein